MNIKEFMPGYMCYNPITARQFNYPEEYNYSSAQFYHSEVNEFGMITHYSGN